MAEDGLKALQEIERGLRKVPRVIRKSGDLSAKAARDEGRARAPVRTGRLQSSFEVRYDNRAARFDVTFPGRYIPLVSGVPSKGIPPHDFVERAIEKAQDEMIEQVLSGTLAGMGF